MRRLVLVFIFVAFCGLAQLAQSQSVMVSTLALSAPAVHVVWDATRSRFFVGSGTNVLTINPETAQIEDTIPVAGLAGQIAVSDDGQYLYVALDRATYPGGSLGIINRYRIQDHSFDLQIALGQSDALAMAVLPGQPGSLLVATSDGRLEAFDGTIQRTGVAALLLRSLYVRPSDGAIFGLGDHVVWLTVNNAGVTSARSVPVEFSTATPEWNGNLLSLGDSLFELSVGATIGRIATPPNNNTGSSGTCLLATDVAGTSAIAIQWEYRLQTSTASLVQYSLDNFRPTASVDIAGPQGDVVQLSALCGWAATWGTDGILVNARDNLYFFHASGFAPIPPQAIPTPAQDSAGVTHLALPANGLVYDPGRNLLWASVPGNAGAVGNHVVSIDPATGNVVDAIYAGSEPGPVALSGDGSHLFAALQGAPEIASIDLSAKRSVAVSVLDASGSLYWLAGSIASIAGQSNSVVAARSAPASPVERTSVIAYDAGVPRRLSFDNGTALPEAYKQYVQVIFPGDAGNTHYAADMAMHYGDGTHDVYRLIVDSNGVKLDTQLAPLPLESGVGRGGSFYASLVYDAGRLFMGSGAIITPDTKRLIGSIALSPGLGVPVPFSDHNAVVYIQSFAPIVTANFYDLATFRPLGSIPITTGPPCDCVPQSPEEVNVTAAVRAGNDSIAVAANGEIVIARLSSLKPWPSSTGALQSVAAGVRKVDMPANAISALPGTSKLLLATPSTDGSVGNSLVTFNGETSQVESATFIGSEPSVLAVSPDGSAAYTYLAGEYNVARLNLLSGSRDLVFAADPTGGTNHYSVFDMAVGPDGGLAISFPGAVAIGGVLEVTPAGGTIAVFNDGVLRPFVDSNSQGPFANDPATFNLAFNDTGSLLYAYNSFLSFFELKREAVTAKGVQWLSSTGGLISGYSTGIRYASGRIYASNGTVVDPDQSLVVGLFTDAWLSIPYSGGFGAVAPDVAGGRVYFVTPSGVLVFDVNTYALLGRLPIAFGPAYYQNYPLNLVRFGSDGLAFLTSHGEVYLVSISAIPLLPTPISSPQPPFIAVNGIVPLDSSVPVVQPGSWISIFGANLASAPSSWKGDFPTSLGGTTVSINSKPAYLSYVSPTLINAQAPDDNVGGPVPLTVTTPNGTAITSISLAPFGPSLSLFDNRYVAAEILTPDGSGMYGGGAYDLVGPVGHFSFQTRPVKSGETLALYGVGFGPTNPPVPAGQAFAGAASTTNPVTVTIGGKSATVLFSGVVAAGLYQINLVVPSVAPGNQPVQAAVGETNAPMAIVTVQ